MINSQNPLRLNVGYMYNKSIGSVREVPLDVDQFVIEDLSIKDLRSVIRMSRTREGLLFQVRAEAEVITSCVRCLNDFYLLVATEFEELYQFQSRYREETDLILPNDGYLDLSSIYREYLILSIPIKGICRTDCAGLCAICGTNLNETLCEHQTEPDVPTVSIESNDNL